MNKQSAEISLFEVVDLEALEALSTEPPAICYVRDTGNYYLKHKRDSDLEATPYSSSISGWHPLDVSSPRYDRALYKVETRWVRINGFLQDLDYFPGSFADGGFDDSFIAAMPSPESEEDVTTLTDVNPGEMIYRVTDEDVIWYVASVEVLDHGSGGEETPHKRKCWNAMYISDSNPPGRFDRISHRVRRIDVLNDLKDQGRVIPGDIIFNERDNTWGYALEYLDGLIPALFARYLQVFTHEEFDYIKEDFSFSKLFILNLTHETQSYKRSLPTGVGLYGVIQSSYWNTRHHPAEFCYYDES